MKNKNDDTSRMVPLTREQFIERTVEKSESRKLAEAKMEAVRLISI